jgi:hypothetical protein
MLHENKPHVHEGLEKYMVEPSAPQFAVNPEKKWDVAPKVNPFTGINTAEVGKLHKRAKLIAEISALEHSSEKSAVVGAGDEACTVAQKLKALQSELASLA